MQRDLILLVILAAVATTTFAQTLPTVGQPGSSTKGDVRRKGCRFTDCNEAGFLTRDQSAFAAIA